jgi:leader peptidase (prepilin peptidase) / N-methyltransferase
MELVLPLAGFGFALGWPLERLIQRFPLGQGTAPSTRRRWVVAALTGLLFAAMALRIGFDARLVPALLLTALVVPASAIDLNHRIIPNAINFPGAALVYVTAVVAQPERWAELLVGGLGGFLFLGFAWAVYRQGMGLGDVKMALMIGLALGRYAAVALFMAFLLSSIPSLAMIAVKGRKGLKTTLPLGPFLAAGAVVALLYGPVMWTAYWGG